MHCNKCGRTTNTSLPMSSLRESTDDRIPSNGKIYKEILLGCKKCKTYIRIFIADKELLPGNSLICDETDGITTILKIE